MASIFALAMLGLTSTASANHGRAYVEIDNRFDGDAVVFANGRYLGEIDGNACERFQLTTGRHRIEVRRPASGYVLATDGVRLGYGEAATVRVYPPRGSLRVANRGDVALRLKAADHSVWVSPGASKVVDVPAGYVSLSAMLSDPRGEYLLSGDRVWVEPGRVETEVLRPNPPTLRVSNREDVPVRIFVDGAPAGLLRPGQVEYVPLRPGSARITLVDPRGRTRLSRHVDLYAGQASTIVLHETRRPRRHHDRPERVVRTSHRSGPSHRR